jgi:hypothetical protein
MSRQELRARNHDRFRVARARGRAGAEDASAVIDASYDCLSDAVRLVFRGGGSMTIPRRFVPGLKGQPASALEGVSVSPAGDALLWTSLDADVYVPALVERAFGHRLFATASGCRRGRRQSKAKTIAARRTR